MTMFNILLVPSFPSDLVTKGRCIGTADINGLNGGMKSTGLGRYWILAMQGITGA
jgi:hypothetical protein